MFSSFKRIESCDGQPLKREIIAATANPRLYPIKPLKIVHRHLQLIQPIVNLSQSQHNRTMGDLTVLEGAEDATELNLSAGICSNLLHDAEIWHKFRCLKKLDLNNNSLNMLPSALEALSPTLDILFLNENEFEAIPEVIGKLKRLRMLSFRGNRLKELSSSNLPSSSLVWLILTKNRITRIDSNVGDLKRLRQLMLSHNELTCIPPQLGECQDLELIRLANNKISVPLPNEVFSLPKLAWISLAGNPIAYRPYTREKEILKSRVSFNESTIFGKGTALQRKFNGRDVALKIIKQHSGGSDGNQEDEVAVNALVDYPFAFSSLGAFLLEDDSDEIYEGMYWWGRSWVLE